MSSVALHFAKLKRNRSVSDTLQERATRGMKGKTGRSRAIPRSGRLYLRLLLPFHWPSFEGLISDIYIIAERYRDLCCVMLFRIYDISDESRTRRQLLRGKRMTTLSGKGPFDGTGRRRRRRQGGLSRRIEISRREQHSFCAMKCESSFSVQRAPSVR